MPMWPGWTVVSGGSVSTSVRIDSSSVGQSPPGRSTRPTEPWKRTSPENPTPSDGSEKVTCPGLWPGVNTTSISMSASSSFSPPLSVCSASQSSNGPKPGQGTKLLMSASTIFSTSGTQTSAPVARATGATAPMWSKCVWVSRIPSRVTPSWSIAASSFGASSPGSMISAWSEPSRLSRKQFSCTGPTVNMRTSIVRRLPALALTEPVNGRVGGVPERDVEHEHDDGEHHALSGTLVKEKHDQQAEDRRRDGRAVGCPPPGGLPVEAFHPPLLGHLL